MIGLYYSLLSPFKYMFVSGILAILFDFSIIFISILGDDTYILNTNNINMSCCANSLNPTYHALTLNPKLHVSLKKKICY